MNKENNYILSICIEGVAGLSSDQVIRKFQRANSPRFYQSSDSRKEGKSSRLLQCQSECATVPWLYYNVIIVPFIHHGKSGMNQISNTVFHNSSVRPRTAWGSSDVQDGPEKMIYMITFRPVNHRLDWLRME